MIDCKTSRTVSFKDYRMVQLFGTAREVTMLLDFVVSTEGNLQVR